MKKLMKSLMCLSCLSGAFGHGVQGKLYQNVFSPETSDGWKKYALQRTKVPTGNASVDIAQALFDLQTCGEDDKIAKFLIENISLASDSDERKACWTKCYNTWKKANDLLAILVTDVDRISCDDERREYQRAASRAVVNRISQIRIAQFYKYDKNQAFLGKRLGLLVILKKATIMTKVQLDDYMIV